MNPKHPIYIPSKGRWETRLTAKALAAIGVPYRLVIEPQEQAQYAAVEPPENLLVLPFSNRGLFTARCWIMEHAISEGAAWHWQLDDNITGFYRLNYNLKTPAASGTIFRCAEDFVERYDNVAQAGFNYFMFVKRKDAVPPYYLNTCIYSCTLLRNDLPYRWRSLYNDDTDLSLMMLKDGWCTVLFNAFLAWKSTTMTVKGGNTEELYLIEDGRLKMAQALVALHPDVARVTWRFNRWQHYVDYSGFRQQLKRKPGIEIPDRVNDFGMVLQERIGDEWVTIPTSAALTGAKR